jgi:Predicted transcription factor, homolog of eukaryotic MBF1
MIYNLVAKRMGGTRMKFSEKLMSLRKSKGMSQEDLATKLNVTRQTISKWELDQTVPDMNKLAELAKLFEISIDELMNDTKTELMDDTKMAKSESEDYENAIEKKNKRISIWILVGGIIISCIILGIGAIKQNEAAKTNQRLYEEASALSLKNYNAIVERVNAIDIELAELNLKKDALETKKNNLKMESSNWFSETQKLNLEIFDLLVEIGNLESERIALVNTDYRVSFTLVNPDTYRIFYYIGAGTFAVLSLISLIYFLVTRRKNSRVIIEKHESA